MYPVLANPIDRRSKTIIYLKTQRRGWTIDRPRSGSIVRPSKVNFGVTLQGFGAKRESMAKMDGQKRN